MTGGLPAKKAPFWSVMIPTYNPSELLIETLQSVISQIGDPSKFEIVVVDDCSPTVDVADLLSALPEGSVEIHRNSTNLRLAGNWNRCIELSQGEWVHILHQDDLVHPGYYEAIENLALRFPEIGMAFSRHEHLQGSTTTLSALEMPMPGVLEDWLARLSAHQRLQCPAAAVRRSVYQKVGYFSEEFYYALDWEMWARIARDFPVGYTPEVLAAYRLHGDSETSRLKSAGTTIQDEFGVAKQINSYLPLARRNALWKISRRVTATQCLSNAEACLRTGRIGKATHFLFLAIRMDFGSLPFRKAVSRLKKKLSG